ncbi:unnamed protein product, partial [marine sediment metagenome]
DILSNKPRRSARQLEMKLDKKAGGNFYFTAPAMHPGTFKVMHIGPDKRKGTKDDIGIADYTKPNRKVKTRTIDGIRYVKLSEVIKDKRKSLKDKEFAFRHKKDLEDINRIKMSRSMSRVGR